MKVYEYKKCNTTGKVYHYTEFVKAKWGWHAPDGSRRHSQSKEGKRVNQCLYNGLRIHNGKKLIGVGHEDHPNTPRYYEIVEQVRKENPDYTNHLLRSDLTKECYIRLYRELGMELPDFDKVRYKEFGRSSSTSESCLSYFGVPENCREIKIGKYFVDGLVDNNIYEFFGDFYHANPEIYEPDSKIFGYTAEEKWEKDKQRIDYFLELGYNVIVIWEKDWKDFESNILTEDKFTEKLIRYE